MSTSANQILIPVDFSDQSLIALDQSYNLAKFYNAELTLLYVIVEGSEINETFDHPNDENALKKEVEKKFGELVAIKSVKHNIKINTVIEKGSGTTVYQKILEVADRINTKMIIMGTNGVSLKRRVIGSNALKVVEGAKCPVVTIKGKHHHAGCEEIVLPIDQTKESEEKVKNAIDLGKLYHATIRLVSVLFNNDKSATSLLAKKIEESKRAIKKAGVKCSSEMIKSSGETLWEAILEYANFMDADLIMIMGQQEQITPDSAALEIIKNSEIPVMSIMPKSKLAENPKK